ncbi:MAG TPA: hypothetical protein DEA55_10335 [Rhodospirillaceae bacterium]|nr:hypothetical protein [Rhodospirillaceae bacterium]
MSSEAHIKDSMDRMYRLTRHIYDASRKYYLLGRDHLIDNLNAGNGEHVCEVGCGTARNLIKLAREYPAAHFYGLDASDEMLKTAQKSLDRNGMKRIKIAQAYAQSFDPSALFGLTKPLNKIFFSYSLSMIPPWRESIDHACNLLPSGGEIHIVDFGDMAGLPEWFKKFLYMWLRLFHVYHKPEILEYLRKMSSEGRGKLTFTPLYKGYAWYAVLKKN